MYCDFGTIKQTNERIRNLLLTFLQYCVQVFVNKMKDSIIVESMTYLEVRKYNKLGSGARCPPSMGDPNSQNYICK